MGMEGKKELDWKPRSIRMSDDLYYSLVKKASEEHMPTAEYIRNILIKATKFGGV